MLKTPRQNMLILHVIFKITHVVIVFLDFGSYDYYVVCEKLLHHRICPNQSRTFVMLRAVYDVSKTQYDACEGRGCFLMMLNSSEVLYSVCFVTEMCTIK